VLSGYGEDAAVRAMLQQGCRGFLQKPVDGAVLIRQLRLVTGLEPEGPPGSDGAPGGTS
jgi:DNA-binding NarL/FixJ family response regulator